LDREVRMNKMRGKSIMFEYCVKYKDIQEEEEEIIHGEI
jgi:hypothetical protein